jgi:energy-coupling factor transporter ATP-binding protein EcfA2
VLFKIISVGVSQNRVSREGEVARVMVQFSQAYYDTIFPALEQAIISKESRQCAIFSGLSGSDKTTLTAAFARYLIDRHHDVVVITGDDFRRFPKVTVEYVMKIIYAVLQAALPRVSQQKLEAYIFESFFNSEAIREFISQVNQVVEGREILVQTVNGEHRIRMGKNSIILIDQMVGMGLFKGLDSSLNILLKRDVERANNEAINRDKASGRLSPLEWLNISLYGTRRVESYFKGLVKEGKFDLILDVNNRENPFFVMPGSVGDFRPRDGR